MFSSEYLEAAEQELKQSLEQLKQNLLLLHTKQQQELKNQAAAFISQLPPDKQAIYQAVLDDLPQ